MIAPERRRAEIAREPSAPLYRAGFPSSESAIILTAVTLFEHRISLFLSSNKEDFDMPTLGLVLSGGGARAAYQAGVLHAVGEVCAELNIKQPFKIYAGVSAGAINMSYLTSHSGFFADATQGLTNLWSNIKSEDVFISNPFWLTYGGVRWLADLSLGGMKGATPGKSLLDTAPLKSLIQKHCPLENISQKIKDNDLTAVAMTALDYSNATSVTFFEAHESIQSWERVRRKSERTQITIEHLMASSAIPLLFPSIKINERFFGDGSIRNLSPCAPAIYMGADRILAIGVRSRQDPCNSHQKSSASDPPSVARVLSVMLNAVMMDGIELDLERINRINTEMQQLSIHERRKLSVRPVEVLWISPSQDLSAIAAQSSQELPRMIRYLLRGLGSLEEASEITSFLLFEQIFCKRLMDAGYEDAMAQKKQLLSFLDVS